MKQTYYNNLVHTDTCDLKNVNTGNAMTKALSDVDACSEGIRKFTTEIFDTGVALFSYIFMLFAYDWKLASFVPYLSPCFLCDRRKDESQLF